MECYELKNYLNFLEENIKNVSKCIKSFPMIISQPNVSEKYEIYIRDKSEEEKLRFLCTKAWFVRCEDSNKIKFLQLLVLSTNENLLISIFNQYYIYLCKDLVYANVSQDPEMSPPLKNPYLDLFVLENVMVNDLDFYILAKDDVKVEYFTELFNMCNGNLKSSIMKYISTTLGLYETVRTQIGDYSKNQMEILESLKIPEAKFINSEKNVIKNELKRLYSNQFENLSQNRIFTNILNEHLKVWESKIDDYKKELGIYVEKPEEPQLGKKGKKSKKDKKSKKNAKKDKSSKDCLDYIQMLPIWIIKPIFNFLEPKDQKSMNLNKYWKFLMKNIRQDIATRNILDNTIQKLQQDKKDLSILQSDRNNCNKNPTNSELNIKNKKRNIIQKKPGKIVSKSLLTEIIEETEDFYNLKDYTCFPRVV